MTPIKLNGTQASALDAIEKKLNRDFADFVPKGCEYRCDVEIGSDGRPRLVCGIKCGG